MWRLNYKRACAAFYRARMFMRHYATAWNTSGEGVHSPYLFYLIEKIIHDENAYYAWAEIEALRSRLKRDRRILRVRDYGCGAEGANGETAKQVSRIARREIESAKVGKLLFRLVTFLGEEAKRERGERREGERQTSEDGLRIVELGTSLGVTTAYLAMADTRNSVTTYEGSEAVAAVAEENWKRLGISNIRVVRGNIDDTLGGDNGGVEKVDLAYLDANHTYEATLRYFDALAKIVGEKSLFVIDDIYYSEEMTAAWEAIKAREDVTSTMDLYHVGLVFFDKHYLKRHYKIRI